MRVEWPISWTLFSAEKKGNFWLERAIDFLSPKISIERRTPHFWRRFWRKFWLQGTVLFKKSKLSNYIKTQLSILKIIRDKFEIFKISYFEAKYQWYFEFGFHFWNLPRKRQDRIWEADKTESGKGHQVRIPRRRWETPSGGLQGQPVLEIYSCSSNFSSKENL